MEAVIVNALYPERFTPEQVTELGGALDRADAPLVRAALTAALSEHARASTQREQRARLRDGLDDDPIELPFIFADHLGRAELEGLADGLDAALRNRGAP
jgi:hypothetical protein